LLYALVTGTVAGGCWVIAHDCGRGAFHTWQRSDALHLLKISLGDPEVAKGIRISHSAEFLLDKQGM
jgi:hypothetical protein